MESDNERIERLEKQYRLLWEEHESLKAKIKANYAEFAKVRESFGVKPLSVPTATVQEKVASVVPPVVSIPPPTTTPRPKSTPTPPKESTSLEQFIGEQLLSKIGIAIVIIGVGIGAKYAIDHQLLSEGMRILGGFLIAGILGFFAFRFRVKYRSFSAVLASGTIAIVYFLVYAAFSFYGLIPYWLAFAGMLVAIISAIYLSIYYNLIVIAHIGLVAAYVLPGLIAKEEAHLSTYFIYMLVIDAGMLILAYFRSWASIPAPMLMWTNLMFSVWYFGSYNDQVDAGQAILFQVLFFLLFHFSVTIRSLLKNEDLKLNTLFFLIPTALSFYFWTQVFAHDGNFGHSFRVVLGIIFILFFFGLAAVFHKRKMNQASEIHLMFGLSFSILAILFESRGLFQVPLIVLEALLLIYFVGKKNWDTGELFAKLILALSSILLIILVLAEGLYSVKSGEITKMLIGLSIVLIGVTVFLPNYLTEIRKRSVWNLLGGFTLLVVLIAGWWGIYSVIQTEITEYTIKNLGLSKNKELASYNLDWVYVRNSCMLAYTFIVVYCTLIYRSKVLKNIHFPVLLLNGIIAFIGVGLFLVGTFSSIGLQFVRREGTAPDSLYYFSRWIIFALSISMLLMTKSKWRELPWLLTSFAVAIVAILSLEQTQWMIVSGNLNGYKLLLSLLWGISALIMIFIGIRKNNPSLRTTAMALLGITVLKLFLFDLTALSTISKTLVFVLIGGCLLVGAYFYNQIAKSVSNDEEEGSKPNS